MFINFWYPAEEGEKVTNEPMKVQMLGLWFVASQNFARGRNSNHSPRMNRAAI